MSSRRPRRRIPWLGLAVALLTGVLLLGTPGAPAGPGLPPAREILPPALGGLPARLDLGALQPGEARRVALPWRRVGDGPLRILAVRTDCGCVAVEVPRAPLPAGARGAIALRVTAGRRPGPLSVRVRVHTDAPVPGGLHVCRLSGYVARPLVARPSALQLGRHTTGRVLERDVELVWSSEGCPGPVTALSTSARGIQARARFEPAARRGGGGGGCLLRLTLHVPAEPGPFAGQVAVTRGHTVVVAIPVRGVAVAAGDTRGR